MRDKQRSEPRTKVTDELLELFKRVSRRMARGIPLSLALAGEGMEPAAYEKHRERYPELFILQEKARREFLESAIEQLLSGERLQANVCWLLERRYPELFVRPADTNIHVTQQIIGVPDEVLQRARSYAKKKD
ncbi:MAG TPA: hypothetical protein VGJ73_10525 [Verrucomicrobiae bacterium]